ncbi:MAG: DegV family protein [Firmicutes bacterium]|nr:DegV family protein [Bacillota bacterium]
MRDFIIMTDSCSDLPRSYIEEKKIPFAMLTCRIGGQEYKDDFGESLPYKKFYAFMRDGGVPKTSQPNTHDFYEVFKAQAEKGLDILYICVSSGLSGTLSSANTARDLFISDYPDAVINIFNILTASLGQGLMVMNCQKMKEEGKSMLQILEYLEANVQKLNTYMVVNDLDHLRRGGRISTAAAVVGKMLNMNAMLAINDEGKVLTLGTVRGRKKAIGRLAGIVAERIEAAGEQTICVSNGDCSEDADVLKELLLREVKPREIFMNFIGPVVGTYGGPGAMAVFFMGKERQHE